MKSKYILFAIISWFILFTIANATTNTFKATLTIKKPLIKFSIQNATASIGYKKAQQSAQLKGNLISSYVIPTATYKITFKNTKQTNKYGKGLILKGDMDTKNIIGAVINSMSWDNKDEKHIKFTRANGNCSLGIKHSLIFFNGSSGSCSMNISGSEIDKINDKGGLAKYNITTAPDVYGAFSQKITYIVEYS